MGSVKRRHFPSKVRCVAACRVDFGRCCRPAYLPGLVRYDEIVAGVIKHPIRFTLSSGNVKPAYISPARHKVNSKGGQYSLPFGAKIRLKASFDISTYPPHLQVILTAMKKYGLILAENGSNRYFSGTPDTRWNNNELQQLCSVTAADFEGVKFH